jgi:hypothetical protein
MSKTNGNEPINPDPNPDKPYFNSPCLGLTKREYFAANAPDCVFEAVSKITIGECKEIFKTENYQNIPNYRNLIKAKAAVDYADALIEALNKEGSKTNE